MGSKVRQNDGIVRGWRIWYTDGSVLSSKETKFEDLPKDGVIAFCLYFDAEYEEGKPYRRVASGVDWYFRAWGNIDWIYGHTSAGDGENAETIRKRYPGAVVLRGKWTDEQTMYRVEKEMMEAIEF